MKRKIIKNLKIKVIKPSGDKRDVKVPKERIRGYAAQMIRDEIVSEKSHDTALPYRKFGF